MINLELIRNVDNKEIIESTLKMDPTSIFTLVTATASAVVSEGNIVFELQPLDDEMNPAITDYITRINGTPVGPTPISAVNQLSAGYKEPESGHVPVYFPPSFSPVTIADTPTTTPTQDSTENEDQTLFDDYSENDNIAPDTGPETHEAGGFKIKSRSYIEVYCAKDVNCTNSTYMEDTLAPINHKEWHPLDMVYGLSSTCGQSYIGNADGSAFDIDSIYSTRFNSEYESSGGLEWDQFSDLHDVFAEVD